jgi:hypothetical protein
VKKNEEKVEEKIDRKIPYFAMRKSRLKNEKFGKS